MQQTGLQQELKSAWKQWIEATGDKYLENPNTEAQLVQAVKLVINHKLLTDRILLEAFTDDKNLKLSTKISFEAFLNRSGFQNRNANILAHYIDFQMK